MKNQKRGDPFATHIDAANECAKRALRENDRGAALRVIEQSLIAIRGLMQFEEPDESKLRLNTSDLNDPRRLVFNAAPEPHRLVYLRALGLLLERVLAGLPAEEAMSLSKPSHREANQNIAIRDVLLFVQVGEHLDRLVARGLTKGDKPIDAAIKEVVENNGVSRATVQKAWSNHGSAKGWAEYKSDWK